MRSATPSPRLAGSTAIPGPDPGRGAAARPAWRALLALVLSCLPGVSLPAAAPAPADTTRPWTRWWWPGSAVDEAGLTRQLELFAAAGLGGVEITPIYGVRGAEDRHVPHLSPRWMELLRHTGEEARRLGLGVDMATGTGWPFGGPGVAPEDGSQRLTLLGGRLTGTPTAMKVKRAAPGAEGLVVDPYSPAALERYLARFSAALAGFPPGLVRGQFHDSFEYYHAGWTPAFPAAFAAQHGYDLQSHAAALLDSEFLSRKDSRAPGNDTLPRLKADYRATLAQLHLQYLQAWIDWSHRHGFVVRNQSHGAPANLLDLYGSVDIPETETFGSTPFPIPGLRQEWTSPRDLPDPLVLRMASSAAHVMGRPLVSSETCTWLREHWQVSLAFTKPEIDRLFTTGINHIFYHGTVYSPPDAAWPGWLFYASTQFHPHNSWWTDFAALNAYVTRVQAVLQQGRPNNDVLLYWPFQDVLHDADGLMKHYGVHDRSWLNGSAFERNARELLQAGYSLDYISDDQLQRTRATAGALVTPGGGRYRALVVPGTAHMPVATLARLAELAQAGALVICADGLPRDVPGLGRLEDRRARFRELLATPALQQSVRPLLTTLANAGIPREPAAATGLEYIRRAHATGHDYFFTNLTAQPVAGWIPLGTPAQGAQLTDPLTGKTGAAALRPGDDPQVYLQIAPGESYLLRTFADRAAPLTPAWSYTTPTGPAIPLGGEWELTFLAGGPALPAPQRLGSLKSWTDLDNETARNFSGSARYRLEFDLPAHPAADDWLLDLGDVRESAHIRLNGAALTTAWSLPFRVRVGAGLKPGRNVLELEVTNLAANRIRDLDRRKVDWKIMHEINFVNLDYKPFDASAWPDTPSGLLGPVTLTPLRRLSLP